MADKSKCCLKNILLICAFILFFFPSFASATTYYVSTSGSDGNSGTSASSAWGTIQKAADTANAGDTVYVMGGTYSQKVRITKSGSSGEYITFASYSGQKVTIDGTSINLGSWDGLIRIDGASYIKISGFSIIKSSYAGIMVSGGSPSNIIIQNNYINGAYSSGIYVEKASAITIDSNEVTGAHTAGAGTHNEIVSLVLVDGFDVKNNYIHDNANTESINAKIGSSNGKIHHNNIKPVASAGIYLDAYTGNEQNIEVFSNMIHDGPGTSRGIAMAVEGGGSLKGVKVYNNVVYNNGAYGIVVAYYANCGNDPGSPCISGTIDNIQIVGNTVYHNDYSAGWGGGIAKDYDKATNIVIKNNIVSQNNKNQIRVVGSGNTVQNNLIDGYAGAANEINAGSNGNIAGNPAFITAGSDFHLQSNSPAIDKGSTAGAPYNIDYDGKSRPAGAAYDMGAYEYGGSSGPCVPSWKCESPLNGYEYDGCNNRRTNSACNPQSSTKAIPGRIEAESYDTMYGIQTTTTGDTGGGSKVGWIGGGDWMDYNVNVQTSGTYSVKYRTASASPNAIIELRKGTAVLNTVSVPNTGGTDTFTTVTGSATLGAGAQTLRIYTATGGFDINWIEFASSCTPSWRCESPLNGYQYDGCGNRKLNAACNAQTTDNPPAISVTHSPTSPTPTTTVTITASATDDKGLSQVMVYVDTILKKTCNTAGASTSCSYASTFPAGTHTYYAIAKDNAGKTATSPTKQFSVTQSQCVPSWKCESPLNGYEYDRCNNRRLNSACNPSNPSTSTLTLKPGWNQISSPIAAGINIATIESSCTILPYKAQKLWGWNAQSQVWIYPTKVEPLKGYWIYAAYACTVPLSGTPATFTSLQLYKGWNKISASGTFSAIQGTCANHIDSNWIWHWDKATEKWIHPATLQFDKGYWIKVDQNCVLGS